MHGIKRRKQKRRTIRQSAPQWPFSPTTGSMPTGSPQAAFRPEPGARNGFSLARNGCCLSAATIPGSKLPACCFASLPVGFRARSAARLHHRETRIAPVRAASTPRGPLHFHRLVQPAAPAISTPLRGCYPPRDQSVQPPLLQAGPPGDYARFPLAPRCPF